MALIPSYISNILTTRLYRTHLGRRRTRTLEKPANKWSYLGFGLYWAWVYLSFNSLQLSGSMPNGAPFIPLLHIVSGLTGCFVFALVIGLHKRLEASVHFGAIIWMAAMGTALGTLFYAVPLAQGTQALAIAGAVISGFCSPWVALSWGLAYCRLDVRMATSLTAGSFLLAGLLYALMSFIPQPVCGTLVSFLPVLSVFVLYLSKPIAFTQAMHKELDGIASHEGALRSEFSTMFKRTGIGRIMLGILLTMFVCGGMRIFIMQMQVDTYSQPLLVALPIAVVALAFLGYGASISRTSLNLGPLYRMAMPLLAIAFVLIAMFGASNTDTSFLIVSAGSTLIDMLTWVLLIEIVRSTHFSALLVLATGRLAIHLGMATGEATGLAMADNMGAFFMIAIVILVIAASYMFTDRDTTFFFEPPATDELPEADNDEEGDTIDARMDAIAQTYGLSPRETEVFKLWASGYGSKAIEEKLFVSAATVKTHLHHIYEKCDVHSRAEVLELIENAASSAGLQDGA